MIAPHEAAATFNAATAAVRATAWSLEQEAALAAVRLLAAHALDAVPDATHLLIESSDQGNYMMCTAGSVERDGVTVASGTDWDDRCELHDLDAAASWLTWGAAAWEQYADPFHPYTNMRGGYVALDLRRIAADQEA